MTVREHLAKAHAAMSEHHAAVAKCCGATAKAVSSVGKASDQLEMRNLLAEHFSQLEKIANDASDAHAGFASDVEKASAPDFEKSVPTLAALVREELGKLLVPDAISSIPRSDTPLTAYGSTAIPRNGAPPRADVIDKSAVAPEFVHLLETGDDEE
jgi:hypothetical protein